MRPDTLATTEATMERVRALLFWLRESMKPSTKKKGIMKLCEVLVEYAKAEGCDNE